MRKCQCSSFAVIVLDIPNGEDTTSLSKAGLLGNTTNALLKDGRDLGGSGLVGVCAGLADGILCGSCNAGLYEGRLLLAGCP